MGKIFLKDDKGGLDPNRTMEERNGLLGNGEEILHWADVPDSVRGPSPSQADLDLGARSGVKIAAPKTAAEAQKLADRIQQLETQAHKSAEQVKQLECTIADKYAIIAEFSVKVQHLQNKLDDLQRVITRSEDLVAYISERYRSESRKRLMKALYNRIRLALSKNHVERKTYEAIGNSVFFDRRFYLNSNPIVRVAGMDPVVHYLRFGSREGRDPSPFFSEIGYQSRYPDVAAAGLSAIQHYEFFGRTERRQFLVEPLLARDVSNGVMRVPLAAMEAQPRTVADAAALRESFKRSGLFEPEVYLGIHDDVRAAGADPWNHFLKAGIWEGRQFTTTDLVARALSRLDPVIKDAQEEVTKRLSCYPDQEAIRAAAAPLAAHGSKIGVYCNSHGNVFLQEIANLLHWQLSALGINSQLRTEEAELNEDIDVRIFVAPHEFFSLGRGDMWRNAAVSPGSVLFNTEQLQTKWYSKALPYLIKAPLVLDLNLQTAILSRHLGSNSIHYMPSYLDSCAYTSAQLDVSDIELVRGYDFSQTEFDWTQHFGVDDRPIDILFIGSSCERRLKALESLRQLTDKYRFVCVYTHQTSPLTGGTYRTTSPKINCALAQRSKIVLNIHRDWIGYFEWSRMVMQGFWQGACVVSDPSFSDAIFVSGTHFLEEATRHLPELLHWLLGAPEGQTRMSEIAAAGHRRSKSTEVRAAMLVPMLTALEGVADRARRR